MYRPRRRRSLPSLALLFSLALPAWAQGNGDSPPDSELVEEVSVRLVEMTILARDSRGRPVTDLTAEEIVVKSRGDRMRIAFLESAAPRIADTPLPQTRLQIDAPGGQGLDPSQPAVAPTAYFAIFVDMENDWRLKRPDAMKQALRFVEERLKPSDRVAVISYDGELRLETPFTNSPQSIRAGLERAYSRGTGRYVDVTRRILDLIERMEQCQTGAGAFVADFDERCIKDTAYGYSDRVRPRAEAYVAALDGVVRYLSGVEGRKTVLALSHGYAVDPSTDVIGAARAIYGNSPELMQWLMGLTFDDGARTELDRLIQDSLRQGVAFHFVDRNPVPNVGHSARIGAAFQPGGERPVAGAHGAAQADVEEFARGTGGTLIKSSDVFEGLSRALDLERGGYRLGYYVDHELSPKELNRVKVNTTRRRVKITHRRGSYAEASELFAANRVTSEIVLGDPATLEEGREGLHVPFRIFARPREIGYQDHGESYGATFSLHVRLTTADGRALNDSLHLINHSYPRTLWEAEDIAPIVVEGWAELPPGDYVLRAFIRNAAEEREGIAERAIRVPGA